MMVQTFPPGLHGGVHEAPTDWRLPVRAGSLRDNRGAAVSLYLSLPGLPTPDQQRLLLGDRCPREGVLPDGLEPRQLQRTADSGRVNIRLVCPECGSWTCGMARDRVVRVRGGTPDDTSWLRPTRHIWIRRKQPWVILPEGD